MTPDEFLAFETAHPTRDSAKENAIRQAGLHPTRFYQQLGQAVRDPDMVRKWPQTCARVQRLDWLHRKERERTSRIRRSA